MFTHRVPSGVRGWQLLAPGPVLVHQKRELLLGVLREERDRAKEDETGASKWANSRVLVGGKHL